MGVVMVSVEQGPPLSCLQRSPRWKRSRS